jgi:tetratricopeptide (TPR) repeat protein
MAVGVRNVKRVALLAILALAAGRLFAVSAMLEQGAALYQDNKPAEARPLLEEAIAQDPAAESAYLYLGIVYQQLGDSERAIAVLKRGLNVATRHRELFLFNIGNNYFARHEYTFAEENYSAAVGADQQLAGAYLNRGSSRLALEKYEGALADYTLYLQLAPRDPQRPAIEQMIGLLQDLLAKRAAQAQAEADRQKSLMNDVMNSLTNASDDARNLRLENLSITDDAEDVDIQE